MYFDPKRILDIVKGTILHPQWLSDRYHIRSRNYLAEIHDSLILDIGSGNSSNQDFIAHNNQIIRLDYPQTNMKYRILPDVFGDARTLPFAQDSVDTVLFFEVLEHIDDDNAPLSEIYRVLNKNGCLYLSVPFIYPTHDSPHDYRRYTIHGVKYVLEKHGFSIYKLIPHGNSLITAIQLFTLSLLEIAISIYKNSKIAGLLTMIIIYPVCIFNNLISYPLSAISLNASTFGYFIIARPKKGIHE